MTSKAIEKETDKEIVKKLNQTFENMICGFCEEPMHFVWSKDKKLGITIQFICTCDEYEMAEQEIELFLMDRK